MADRTGLQDENAPEGIRHQLDAAQEAVSRVQRTYFDEDADPASAMSDFKSATSWRSTSISGVEDWCSCSVTSNGTTVDDWKSVDDDMPEEWVEEDGSPEGQYRPAASEVDEGGEKTPELQMPVTDEPTGPQTETDFLKETTERETTTTERTTKEHIRFKDRGTVDSQTVKTLAKVQKLAPHFETRSSGGPREEKVVEIKFEADTNKNDTKLEAHSPKVGTVREPQKSTATMCGAPVIRKNVGTDVLSKLEAMKSKYHTKPLLPPPTASSEGISKESKTVEDNPCSEPSAKDKTEISRVTYSKESTETRTMTRVSYEQQTLRHNRADPLDDLQIKRKHTQTCDKKAEREIPVFREITDLDDWEDTTYSVEERLTKSKEWIQLKIQEMHPSMTDIGVSLHEAIELNQQHEKVLEKLQTKQSPVEELLRQADELIATQKPRGEVYSAMAENLGLAWKDLNAQLEQRRQILEQAVAFFARSKDFADALDKIQKSIADSYLPDTVEVCSTMLQRHQEDRKVALSCSMHTLKEGQHLLEKLCEVATHSMGDSRPFHMNHAARQTSSFVERHMEALHDRWRHLEALWLQRKLKLEQCLKRCQFLIDLNEVQTWLSAKGAEFASQQNLGDSAASAEILQHEHSKIEKESKDKQDQALKLVKTAEQLAYAGNYAGEELKVKAYEVLSECSDLLNVLETRNLLLSISIAFFNSAQTALNKLDQIEIQLLTSDGVATASQQTNLNAAIEEIASPAIEEGRNLINRTESNKNGVQGVIRKVEELEDRRRYLLDLCGTQKAENSEWLAAFSNFNTNCNMLLSWIANNGIGFLQRNRDMGTTQPSATHFVHQHITLQNEMRIKGIEVEAVLSTVPSLVRVGGADAQDVLNKSENLRDQWNKLRTLLDRRISIAECYLVFHRLATRVAKEIDDLDSSIRRLNEGFTPTGTRNVEEAFLTLQQGILQLKNSGRNFLEDARKVDDEYLNMIQPCNTVQSILDNIDSRKLTLTTQWTTWQSQITTMKEALVQWEHLVKDSNRVIKCAEELESKMFPVIPKELSRVESILPFLENRMVVLLPQIKSVQQEMDSFLKKSDVLCPKDKPEVGQKVVDDLQRMNQSFQKKLTDYQILISMMTSYFKNFEELQKMVELQETQFKMTPLPNDRTKTEMLLHDHKTGKSTVLELFKSTYTEAEHVIKKINEAEPTEVAWQDKEKITSIYEQRKSKFESLWDDHKKTLDQHLQMCMFNYDMQQINQQIVDLNDQLAAMKQRFGDSLPSSITTSQAFVQFEKTIEILESRIRKFVTIAEKMVQEKNVDTTHVHREIQSLQNKWSTFQTQVNKNRQMIDLSIEYFKLVEESEEWLKEGSRVLISIARRSSICKNANDASGLHDEIKDFLDKGRNQQEERLRKLSFLSVQLYGDKTHPSVQHVTSKNKDMLDSFSVINSELTVLTENIRKAEVEKIKEAREKEELDAALLAAQLEAETAKAAALAAQESAKAAEAAAKAVPVVKEEVKPVMTPAKIHTPPRFVVPLSDVEVPEGTKFSFECKVEGYPEPQVQWFKDGILAQNNPDYQTKYENGFCVLTIEETFSEDSAKFTCRAVNSSGVAETHGNLLVKETRVADGLIPPHFIKEPADAIVVEGTSHNFDCQVSGNPLPLVSWFKDDVCIDNSVDYFLTYNNGYCTLRLEDCSTEHSGRYTCRAINQAGQIACSVTFLVKTSVPSERPMFVTPLSNVMARAGQKLRLECGVTGRPEPQLTWLHNSKSIKETRDIKMQFDGRNANLVITEAFPKDAGTYTVVARNKAGEAVSTCNVSVKGRLPLETSDSEMASDIEPAKPLVKQQLDDQTVEEGDKVRMDCIIVGQPEPEVIWYHNGKPVKESDDFQLLFEGDRCTLIIKVAYLEDSGTYKCVAINSGGEASSQCHLTVKTGSAVDGKSQYTQKDIVLTVEKSNPPKFVRPLKDVTTSEGHRTKLECQVTGDGEITLKWFKNNQEINTSLSPDYEVAKEESGFATLTVGSVKASHQGTFSVTAHNKGGEAQSFCCLTVLPSTSQTATQTSVQELPPTFLKHLEETRIHVGQPVKLESVVTGTPKPKIHWNFQGKLILEDSNHQMKEDCDRYSLLIPKASKDHSGRYSVVAENNSGVATSSALLQVEEPFSQVTSDSYQEQMAHSMIMSKKTTVVEKCTISSMSEVSEAHETTPEREAIPETKVSVVEVSKPKPAPDSSTTSIVEKVSIPPKFTKPVSTALVLEGEKLLLEGQVEGTPEPDIKWFKDGTELHSKPGLIVSNVKGKTSLFILRAVEVNSGVYSCVATNASGKATSMAEVKVKTPQEAPKFLKALQAGVFKSGARINMPIEVSGIPSPEVKWYRNGAQLQNSPDFRIASDGNKHSLSIQEAFPDDSGTFVVTATNIAGQAKCIADLIVEEDRSPEEEKVVSYQEVSSVQQKKETFTKISVAKSAHVERYEATVDPQPQPKPIEQVVPKTPSPPPIPAVSSKVWSQTRPELITPTVEQIASFNDLPEVYPDDAPLVEFPAEAPEDMLVDETSTTPATSIHSESFVKQTVMKFSEQQPQAKTQKPLATKSEESNIDRKSWHQPMQNGITKHESVTSSDSVQTLKQQSFSSETKTQMVHSFSSSKSETTTFNSSMRFTSESDSDQKSSLMPVWRPIQRQKEPDAEVTWRPVQPYSTSDGVLSSADVTHYHETSVTPFSETKVVTVAPTLKDVSVSKSSVHQSFDGVVQTSKKYETFTHEKQSFESRVKTDFSPKPIIKKEPHLDGPKPKKEVVIEEEPVVGAEVRPPVFSKVRGPETFRKMF